MPRPAGLPKTGGRKPGSLNKITADVKQAAQAYTSEAVEALASIMRASESDAARVAAANAILDRGHGRPKQSVEVDAVVTERRVSDKPLSEDEWSEQHAQK